MNYKLHLITGACLTALAFSGTMLAAEKKSPSPAASPMAADAAAPAAAKPPRAVPFRGKATEIDQSAKTFTIVGKTNSRVFKATDATTITKGGASATLAELTNDEYVTGSYLKQEDGSLELKSLKIGGKTEEKGAAKKSESAAPAAKTAASPSASPKKK